MPHIDPHYVSTCNQSNEECLVTLKSCHPIGTAVSHILKLTFFLQSWPTKIRVCALSVKLHFLLSFRISLIATETEIFAVSTFQLQNCVFIMNIHLSLMVKLSLFAMIFFSITLSKWRLIQHCSHQDCLLTLLPCMTIHKYNNAFSPS